jgi:hypothetical protein
VLLLLGMVMTSTLVLLPVGLPLALLAIALIAAPSSPRRDLTIGPATGQDGQTDGS